MDQETERELDPQFEARFEVLEQFEGGEGLSLRVREHGSEDERLLKILDGTESLEEASLLLSLPHPRIPRLRELGRCADGRPFLLRDFVPGKALDGRARSPAECQALAEQVLEVLAYVHARGIVHLDLKPANLIVDEGAGQERVHLLDFGLATRRGKRGKGGTPFFAAPELLLGLETGPRSDLFSLGAMLALLALGKQRIRVAGFLKRFPRESFFDAIQHEARSFPEPLNRILPRLVARHPGRRFADAQEVLEAFGDGTGRPQASMLYPDPIRYLAAPLEEALEKAPEAHAIALEGAATSDRAALALHLHTLGAAFRDIEERDGRTILRMDADSEPVTIAVPSLQNESLVEHLSGVLSLESEAAERVARELLQRHIDSPAAVGAYLEERLEAGQLIPSGTRWLWPDAQAGRALSAQEEVAADADGIEDAASLRRCAAEGHIERALHAFRERSRGRSVAEERALRHALCEGLLRSGEARRVLPLAYDAPSIAAQALLDLGRIDEAEARARELADPSSGEEAREHEMLHASIDYARGRTEEAEKRAERLVSKGAGPEASILLGLLQAARGDAAAARATLMASVDALSADEAPYLRGAALTNLGETERQLGSLQSAFEHHEEALALFMKLGQARFTATASSNLGVLAKDLQDFDAARTHQRRARSLYEHLEDAKGVAVSTANLGILELEAGNPAEALPRIDEAIDRLSSLGALEPLPLLRVLSARAHAELGRAEEARAALASAGPISGDRIEQEARKTRGILRKLEERAKGSPAESRQPPAHAQQEEGKTIAAEQQRSTEATESEDDEMGIPTEVFRTFLTVNRRLATEPDLERAMLYLLDSAVSLSGARTGLLLLERESGVRKEFHVGEKAGPRSSFSRSLANRAITEQRSLSAEDALADRDLMQMASVRGLEVRSALCSPFMSLEGTKGAIYVEHPGRAGAFGDREKEHLEVLADQAAIAVDRMLREESLELELAQSRRELRIAQYGSGRAKAPKLLGESAAMEELRTQIRRIAESELSVLILGETGSGKELVARALHEQSSRFQGPLVSENCSAIPEELLESTFFGHVKGAFTGADVDREGLFLLANSGTIFLDEIGDMPQGLQTKLLRALQEGKVRRVGDSQEIPVDVRVIAATHKDPKKLIESGSFREDLYFRIAATEIRIPPLRERGEDALLIAEHFLRGLSAKHAEAKDFGASIRDEILNYPWPGNVRELEHVVARAYLLAEGSRIETLALQPVAMPKRGDSGGQVDGMSSGSSGDLGASEWPAITLKEAEHRTIDAMLTATGGDKTKAARRLGISRTALYEKLKRRKSED